MKPKAIIPRHAAVHDVDQAISHYVEEGAPQAALDFIQALENAYNHIARYPDSGSPRHGHELDIPGLRSWPLKDHPFLVFYLDRKDHVDVWRVLHQRLDIPSSIE